jgi:hypothetical protein
VRVFVRTGTRWSEVAQVSGLDTGDSDRFGTTLDLDGGTLLVGAPNHTHTSKFAAGAVYVFVGGGASWTQQAKLVAGNAKPGNLLGTSVALDGDTALAGAPWANNAEDGAAYVFVRNGTSWTQQQKLSVAGQPGDQLGISVALAGDSALVGSSRIGAVQNGAVFVFERDGAIWATEGQLESPTSDPNDGDWAFAAALDGGRAVFGSPHDDGVDVNAGAAYVFTLQPGGEWIDLGHALPGVAGAPLQTASGAMIAGAPFIVSLAQAKAFASAYLVTGVVAITAPFKGGVLVPRPDLLLAFGTNAVGGAVLGGQWPPGLPPGASLYLQWWIADPAGPAGFAASNAIEAATP